MCKLLTACGNPSLPWPAATTVNCAGVVFGSNDTEFCALPCLSIGNQPPLVTCWNWIRIKSGPLKDSMNLKRMMRKDLNNSWNQTTWNLHAMMKEDCRFSQQIDISKTEHSLVSQQHCHLLLGQSPLSSLENYHVTYLSLLLWRCSIHEAMELNKHVIHAELIWGSLLSVPANRFKKIFIATFSLNNTHLEFNVWTMNSIVVLGYCISQV